ncbi:MAG: M23 family metallopeptidase [Rickettsiales bacterium]|jgi:hypothetical protein|nr:M23 family metallopeptidase [Rickettsiales bacterium]
MTNDELVRHLYENGINAELIGDTLIISDQSCFVRSAFEFFDNFQVILYIMAGLLLAGWAISMIRGAKIKIMNNLRNLCLLFAVLAMVRPIMVVFYGGRGELDESICRKVKVSADSVRRAIAQQKSGRAPDGFIGNMVEGGISIPDIGKAIVIPRPSEPSSYSALHLTQLHGRSNHSVWNVQDISALRLSDVGHAQQIAAQYGFTIRTEKSGGGSGHLGASRDHGARDHLGTDLFVKGHEMPINTAMPALFSGEVVRIAPVYGGRSNLKLVEIRNDNGTKSRILYVQSNLKYKDRVNAGDIIGYSQDIKHYYGKDIPQHIHFELIKGSNTVINTEGVLFNE